MDPIIPDIEISSNGLLNLLKGLNPGKAAGPDKITPLVLRELREQIVPVINIIFSLSIQTGEVPQDWTATPLYKKGDKAIAANYRSISRYHSPVFYVRSWSMWLLRVL